MTKPTISFALDCAEIGDTPVSHRLALDATGCAALAGRFDLRRVIGLSADCRLERCTHRDRGGAAYWLECHLRAEVEQECVVTLEPIKEALNHQFRVMFVPNKRIDAGRKPVEEAIVSVEDADREPYCGNILNIGEVIAQHFGLALNFYPRHAEAEAVMAAFAREAAEHHPGPFGLLLAGKDKA